MNPYRIVLADDHRLFREGIKEILMERPDFMIVGEVSDGIELLDFLKQIRANLILLDISMPKLWGIDVIPEIKKTQPHMKILMLTMIGDTEYVPEYRQAARDSMADYFVLKDSSLQDVQRLPEKPGPAVRGRPTTGGWQASSPGQFQASLP